MRREDFIPETIWIRRDDGWMVPVRRSDDPEAWLREVNGSEAVTTQVDDGSDEYDGKGIIPTSSSTAGWLMDKMLTLLDVRPGMNILEIGAGTGYNAALLAERAEPGSVATIEVDPIVATHARAALARLRLPVTVITGDGADGYAQRAPFDRVIATANVFTVPPAWLAQTRPRGRIVVPIAGSFHHGALACLTVAADGTAHGRFHGEAPFMYMRNQRRVRNVWGTDERTARITYTGLHPIEPFTDFHAGFAFSTRMQGCTTGRRPEEDGTEILWISHHPSGSWGSFIPGTDRHEVCQSGPRNLWNELEDTYRWWIDADSPDHTRIGITVTTEGQKFWLDTPEHTLPAIQGSAV
ncbi:MULTISPECIES: methyltransferase domain-containing protein [unclassified Frankia]|uniref:methyltransferase domain-containing protein n=1 Tax=unclassified Frankia TaxID=2632575 RepID=UPI001EF51428|nr:MULTISPECIES: methyltransferase domain-containing protein [unclassified Frankia]